MNWDAIGAAAETLGAIGVIVTLGYLAIQVRQNTKTLKAQIHESMTTGYLSIVEIGAANAKVLSAGVKASPEEFASFSDEEKTIFLATIYAIFKHYELMHMQHERGLIDNESWEAWSVQIRMEFHQPGVQMWWTMRRATFIKSFREYLESSTPPDAPTMVDLMERS
jgi:hypothetical protein